MTRGTLPFKIIQTGSVTAILLEEFNNWRQIFTDGRPLPIDPQPAWFGYSVGKWKGTCLSWRVQGSMTKPGLTVRVRLIQKNCTWSSGSESVSVECAAAVVAK
jgi:hypothetical protein